MTIDQLFSQTEIEFHWTTRPDPELANSTICVAEFADSRVVIHKVSMPDVWGWLLIEAEQGGVVDMRSGYKTIDDAKAGFERYFKSLVLE